jgi:hypothetical protein
MARARYPINCTVMNHAIAIELNTNLFTVQGFAPTTVQICSVTVDRLDYGSETAASIEYCYTLVFLIQKPKQPNNQITK